ncbi:MAG TPA: TetR/AcrR family transcriptional regulator [Candidatus Limnocylindrales bacterium]|nr:TetR/AcrR family transcriptional regulator [Candidatus Limnocylindrales bacterium]
MDPAADRKKARKLPAGSSAATHAASAISATEAEAGRRPAAIPTIERPTRRSRKTRKDLVDAARELLEEQGVPALTVKAVTERADVGHGTFYHHFPSTEAVLAAGIEASMREFAAAIEREFSEASDKAWVFVKSMSSTFRMLTRHPALPWMLERPQVLAAALREACGPFARRDVAAMVAAGDVHGDALPRVGHYWEWIIVGALSDAAGRPLEQSRIEAGLIEMVLRILGLDDARIRRLLSSLDAAVKPNARKKGA